MANADALSFRPRLFTGEAADALATGECIPDLREYKTQSCRVRPPTTVVVLGYDTSVLRLLLFVINFDEQLNRLVMQCFVVHVHNLHTVKYCSARTFPR